MKKVLIQIVCVLALLVAGRPAMADCVILLHGLARTPASMEDLAVFLEERGYTVANVGYPSRKKPIEELAAPAIEDGLRQCPQETTVHFVTHSLGGILVRYYLDDNEIAQLGRVVMLTPPNQGSEIVDALKDVPGYEFLNGPSGQQLGTGPESIPAQLGPVEFELGVIAGDKTIDPIGSQFLPNPDDGKVSVESTKVKGMNDFIQVSRSHAMIMQAPEVMELVVSFIETGEFIPVEP